MLWPLAIVFGSLFVVLSVMASALRRWPSWWPWIFGAAAGTLFCLVFPWEHVQAGARVPLVIAIAVLYLVLAMLSKRRVSRLLESSGRNISDDDWPDA